MTQAVLTVQRRPHVVEVDVLAQCPVFRQDKDLDDSYGQSMTEGQHSDRGCGKIPDSHIYDEERDWSRLSALCVSVGECLASLCLWKA